MVALDGVRDISASTRRAVGESAPVSGWFWLADGTERVPGTLRCGRRPSAWRCSTSSDRWARIGLVSVERRWLSSARRCAAKAVALVDARASQDPGIFAQSGHLAWLRYRAFTLALGDLVRDGDLWTRAAYETSALHAWIPRNGLSVVGNEHEHPLNTMQVRWSRPARETVPLRGATLTFDFGASRPWGYSPTFSIDTKVQATFDVDEALTAQQPLATTRRDCSAS